MSGRRPLVFAYRHLLQLYPAAFRQRFAAEMLEVAEAAELSEWPLIFGDTSVAIACSWLKPDTTTAVAMASGPDQYLSLGDSAVKPLKLFQGLAMATVLVLGACYISTLTVWHLPSYPDDRVCGRMPTRIARR
jgi:hypothetical protein